MAPEPLAISRNFRVEMADEFENWCAVGHLTSSLF